jgi:hypothetical protein
MSMRALRVALVAAVFSVSAFLLACTMGQLRLQIPDFETSGVVGIQLFRVDDTTGQLVDAGRIEFLGIETTAEGEFLKYKQLDPSGAGVFGPVSTQITRPASYPNGIEMTLAYMNQLPAGWFKVASYNLIGTSTASASQTFIAGQEG